jgi:hypothetical protein
VDSPGSSLSRQLTRAVAKKARQHEICTAYVRLGDLVRPGPRLTNPRLRQRELVGVITPSLPIAALAVAVVEPLKQSSGTISTPSQGQSAEPILATSQRQELPDPFPGSAQRISGRESCWLAVALGISPSMKARDVDGG